MDNKGKPDFFGTDIKKANEQTILNDFGQLKDIFKPKEIKYNRLEKPFERIKKKDKFM